MLAQRIFDQRFGLDEGAPANIALEIVLSESDHSSLTESHSCHMRERLSERRIASNDHQFLLSALIENQRVAFALLIEVIVNSNLQARLPQLFRQVNGAEISVDKIAKLRLLSLSGST